MRNYLFVHCLCSFAMSKLSETQPTSLFHTSLKCVAKIRTKEMAANLNRGGGLRQQLPEGATWNQKACAFDFDQMPSHLLIRSFKNTNGDEREKSPGSESGSINSYLYRLRTEPPMKLSPEREVKGGKRPF